MLISVFVDRGVKRYRQRLMYGWKGRYIRHVNLARAGRNRIWYSGVEHDLGGTSITFFSHGPLTQAKMYVPLLNTLKWE